MQAEQDAKLPAREAVEHFDVLIVGAGISGIDAAYHLQQQCPGKRFALLENQDSFGGTWLTHKYPGIRSDSDLFTFGYKWKPWTGVPIATGDEILRYLAEVIEEHRLGEHMRYRQKVKSASWSNDEHRWTLEVTHADESESPRLTCNFLWMCQGYYRHSEGYTPDFPGMDRFQGPVVHPQTWPDHLDYKGKQVIVIGSGATAATLIPAMADECAHVTMLQRSPTYFYARPNSDEVVDLLRMLKLPDEWIHEIARRKVLHDQKVTTRRSFDDSDALKQELIGAARAYLGDDFDLDTHFTPSYRPWRQRLAVVPDGDLFKCIRSGKASVVTDQIETFTENGIQLKSGKVSADTKMLANTEGAQLVVEVWHALSAGYIKRHGVVTENSFIVVGRVVVQKDFVALLYLKSDTLAIIDATWTDRNHFGFLGLLFGGVGNDDPAF